MDEGCCSACLHLQAKLGMLNPSSSLPALSAVLLGTSTATIPRIARQDPVFPGWAALQAALQVHTCTFWACVVVNRMHYDRKVLAATAQPESLLTSLLHALEEPTFISSSPLDQAS